MVRLRTQGFRMRDGHLGGSGFAGMFNRLVNVFNRCSILLRRRLCNRVITNGV